MFAADDAQIRSTSLAMDAWRSPAVEPDELHARARLTFFAGEPVLDGRLGDPNRPRELRSAVQIFACGPSPVVDLGRTYHPPLGCFTRTRAIRGILRTSNCGMMQGLGAKTLSSTHLAVRACAIESGYEALCEGGDRLRFGEEKGCPQASPRYRSVARYRLQVKFSSQANEEPPVEAASQYVEVRNRMIDRDCAAPCPLRPPSISTVASDELADDPVVHADSLTIRAILLPPSTLSPASRSPSRSRAASGASPRDAREWRSGSDRSTARARSRGVLDGGLKVGGRVGELRVPFDASFSPDTLELFNPRVAHRDGPGKEFDLFARPSPVAYDHLPGPVTGGDEGAEEVAVLEAEGRVHREQIAVSGTHHPIHDAGSSNRSVATFVGSGENVHGHHLLFRVARALRIDSVCLVPAIGGWGWRILPTEAPFYPTPIEEPS